MDPLSRVADASRAHGGAQSTCARINRIFFDDPDEAQRLFAELVPGAGSGIDFRPPINLDYGIGLTIGDRTFINKDFLVVGGGRVTIGPDCLIGPRCSIYTPNHAEHVERRRAGWERARPSPSVRASGSADRSRSCPA